MTVTASERQGRAVVAERYRIDRGVGREEAVETSAGHVPHFDQVPRAAAGQKSSVTAERHRGDPLFLAAEDGDMPAGNVPKPDHGFVVRSASDDQCLAIRAERN